MKYVEKNEHAIFFDVDQTLVMHGADMDSGESVVITCPYTGAKDRLIIHQAHVRMLKGNAARGYSVYVWSHHGVGWAKQVIYTLGLEEFVTAIIPKPISYVDDKHMDDWDSVNIYVYGGIGN